MKTPKSERGFAHYLALLVIVLVLVAGAGVYLYHHQKTKTTTATNASVKKLSHPGVIQSEVFASSLDASGAPVQPSGKFSTTTPKIYVSVGLSNAKTTQRLEYTRYLNGKFVNNGSIPVTKDSAKYASFAFALKPGKTHLKGTYLVKTYTNGIFEKSATYTVE